MWGRSDAGQLGLPKSELTFEKNGYVLKSPKEVSHFKGVQELALGEAHTVILDIFGQVSTFGWNALGQLGCPN